MSYLFSNPLFIMERYIHLFNSKNAHDEVYDSETLYTEPWVSYINETSEITYNIKPYKVTPVMLRNPNEYCNAKVNILTNSANYIDYLSFNYDIIVQSNDEERNSITVAVDNINILENNDGKNNLNIDKITGSNIDFAFIGDITYSDGKIDYINNVNINSMEKNDSYFEGSIYRVNGKYIIGTKSLSTDYPIYASSNDYNLLSATPFKTTCINDEVLNNINDYLINGKIAIIQHLYSNSIVEISPSNLLINEILPESKDEETLIDRTTEQLIYINSSITPFNINEETKEIISYDLQNYSYIQLNTNINLTFNGKKLKEYTNSDNNYWYITIYKDNSINIDGFTNGR